MIEAVKRCWASLWTGRAIGYRERQGIGQEDVSMAVVVQQLVSAEVSGVVFTANPTTGARDELMIDAAWGLGEARRDVVTEFGGLPSIGQKRPMDGHSFMVLGTVKPVGDYED